MKPNKENYLENYIIACTNFYGIIREDQLKKIYLLHHNEPIDLSNIDYEYLNNEYIHYKFQFFMVEVFLEEDMISQYIGNMNHKPIYYPNKTELMKYLDDSYIEMNNAIATFVQYINEHTPKSKEVQYQNFIDEVLFSQNIGFDLDRLDTIMTRNGVYKLKLQDILPLVADVCEHVRLWVNNGYTNGELIELDKNDPNIDILDYGDIDDHFKKALERYKQEIQKMLVKVPIDIYAFTNPSLNDLIKFAEYDLMDLYYDVKPAHLLSALIRMTYEKNEQKFTEKRKEYYFRALGIWTQKEEADIIYDNLESAYEIFDIENYTIYLKKFYETMNYKPINNVTKEDIRKLFYTQKSTAINSKIKTKIEKLCQLITKGSDDSFVPLFNLCNIYPLSTHVLYEFIVYCDSKYDEILLKAVIQSFELSYPDLLKAPNQFKKSHKSFDIYMKALKDLGLIYKQKLKMDEAIQIYQKMLYSDEKDKYDARASMLICYIHLNQYEHYFETLERMSDNHMFKHILSLVSMIESGQPFDVYYRDVVEHYSKVFKHLLLGYDKKDMDLSLSEREFIEDFGYLFQSNLKLKTKLLEYYKRNKFA